MPPRWLTWAIIAFWVGMTGWLAFQQYSLRQRVGEPPPFTIDLTDEVGANEISWNVIIDGKKQGQAYSSVKFRRKDHTFNFNSWFRANDKELASSLLKIISNYRVNQDGELLEIGIDIVIEQGPNQIVTAYGRQQEILFGASIAGMVEEGKIKPAVWMYLGGKKLKMDLSVFGVSSEIKVSRSFLNPMHLLNKVSGLHEGQEWPIQLMEFKGFETMSVPILKARVSAESISWNGQDVACFLIEYREQNRQRVHARTWVRQRDGLVLQQQADYMGRQLLFQRENRK